MAGGLGRKHFILNELILFLSNCGNSNLNGHYYTTGYYKGMSDGIFWNSGKKKSLNRNQEINSNLARGRFYSFRTTEMRIRPMTSKEQRDMAGSDKGRPAG